MFIRNDEANKYVCITSNNLDSISLERGNNVLVVLNGNRVSLGTYNHLEERTKNRVIDMMFEQIQPRIDTNELYEMPQTDTRMIELVDEFIDKFDKSHTKEEE